MPSESAIERLAKKSELRLLVVCMILLAAAAAWLLSTRPRHRIEGDFLEREARFLLDDWLRGQFQNPVAEHRARACLALGRIGGGEALEILALKMEDPAPSVRAAAAFGIGLIEDAAYRPGAPDPAAADALMRALNDSERRVVSGAVEALGKIGVREAAQAFTETPAPLVVTLTALTRMRARQQIPWMAIWLKSEDQDARWAAALTLVEIGAEVDEEIAHSFLNLTRDRNNFVRAAATRGLGFCPPSEEIFEAIERVSLDLDVKIRIEAIRALARLGARERVDQVIAFLGDPNENVSAEAALALGALRDARAEPLLDSLTQAREPVAGAARAALRALRDDREPLDPALPRDPVPLRRAIVPPPESDVREAADYQRIARTLSRKLRMETSVGVFDVTLDYEHAPAAAERFWEWALAGRFDGAQFERVVPNGYVQAAAAAERPAAARCEIHTQPFLRGSIGMVRLSISSDAEEFFIALTSLPFADGRYTNLGRLTSGDDLLDQITTETRILRFRAP